MRTKCSDWHDPRPEFRSAPTTEANLGDGLFPLTEYLDAGGEICVGSDSQIPVSLVEELRWLEYGQRLQRKQRNVAAMRAQASSGESLFQRAHGGGIGAHGGCFDDGAVVLDGSAIELRAATPAPAMDRRTLCQPPQSDRSGSVRRARVGSAEADT